MQLSYQHAINAIKLLYQHSGFDLPKQALGEQVANEFKAEACESKLGALYAFVDEQIALLRLVSWYFLSAFKDGDERPMVFYQMTIFHLKTLSSIRLLCTHGLDTNARLQLRLLFENSLLWSRFRVEPTALNQYSKCADPMAANAYWHKYMSKSKIESFLSDEFKASGHIWLGGIDEMIFELKEKVGLVAHPTFIASKFESNQDWNKQDERFALSSPSVASHFTLSQAVFVAAIPFSIKPEPSYQFESANLLDLQQPLKPLPHSTTSWNEYNQHLRDMIPKLFLMSRRFSDALLSET